MILLPDSTVSSHPAWEKVGALTYQACLESADGATTYTTCDNDATFFRVGYANPPVAEEDIDFDEDVFVRFLSSGKSAHRNSSSLVDIDFNSPTGNPTQSCSYDAHRTDFTTVNGTSREFSDGSSAAWTYSDLESLEMKCTKDDTVEVWLSYLALEVTYTAVAGEEVITDNATFFGANF